MSDTGAPRKLKGYWVPQGASTTSQGPRLRHKNGRFAAGGFENVELTVLPDGAVQALFDALPEVVEGIVRLDGKLETLQGAVARVQHSVDTILFKLDRDLRVEVERAGELLEQADDMGEDATRFLADNERLIDVPLRKVEVDTEGYLAHEELPLPLRVCLLKRFLLARHGRAKVALACGNDKKAHRLREEPRRRILPLARALFATLTDGVAVWDSPGINSAEDEAKLFRLMEIVDGEPPDLRRWRLRKALSPVPNKMTFVTLERVQATNKDIYHDRIMVNIGIGVRKGQTIVRCPDCNWIAATSGFLVEMDYSLPSHAEGKAFYNGPGRLAVLAIPTLEAPRPDLANLIADLAFVVDYACSLEQDTGMDAASGNAMLAERLMGPDSE